MIKLGDNNVTLKLGDNDVSKVYLGDTQIYPSVAPISVSLERINSTQYVVNGSGSASLKFKRISDDAITDLGMQTLPYTFTHTIGERYEVSANNAPYVFDNNIRFIKDQINGSLELSTFNNWHEIRAYNESMTNMALLKGATLSKTHFSSLVASNAVDGNDSTQAAIQHPENDFIVIDLDSIVKIEIINVLHHVGRSYKNHNLYVSKDGVDYFLIYSGDKILETSSGIDVIVKL